jgi:undecaprenyl-phosphate 4-deoxy-4-formamido-L-arabinose transferase
MSVSHPSPPQPFLSVVIPVYNEEANLKELFSRLTGVLKTLGRPFEIIFVNDGSVDKSSALLKEFFETHPQTVRVIEFNGNYGQHMAIMAGFQLAKGEFAVTMDADLQNPPEELPKIVEPIDRGHDYVGSFRLDRQDTWFRTYASRLTNWMRRWVTGLNIKDHGCMLRAYHHTIVKAVVACPESSTLIPVLAYTFASTPTEVGIVHNARENDGSKYTLYKLIRMYFDLFTGFSLLPLQLFTLFGLGVSCVSSMLVGYLLLRRLLIGPEAEGLFTLFAILFFLISVVITGIGILGEYIGRIYQAVRRRPRFLIRRILSDTPPAQESGALETPAGLCDPSHKEGT